MISDTFAVLRPGSQFLAIEHYHPLDGGVFNVIMSFRSSYTRVCEDSVRLLKGMNVREQWRKTLDKSSVFHGDPPFDYDTFTEAYQCLLESLRESAAGINERGQPIRDAYTVVRDANGKPVHGVKFHINSQTLHVDGIMVRTTMVEAPPRKPEVESKPITLAKDFLRDQLPISHWRQYRLVQTAFKQLKIQEIVLDAADAKIVRG